MTDVILKNMDSRQLTCVMYLDLKKAFDTVDTSILLIKLEMYCIRNNEFRWFQNYRTGRSQVVSVNGATSDSHDLDVGVPQGSTLGPLLFIVLIMIFLVWLTKCKITLYAVDTALLFSSKRVHEIQTVLTSKLKHVNNWFKNNKLTLNVIKTKYTVIWTSQLLKNKSPNLTLSIDNNILEHVTCYKYLGVYSDENLNWSHHTDMM